MLESKLILQKFYEDSTTAKASFIQYYNEGANYTDSCQNVEQFMSFVSENRR